MKYFLVRSLHLCHTLYFTPPVGPAGSPFPKSSSAHNQKGSIHSGRFAICTDHAVLTSLCMLPLINLLMASQHLELYNAHSRHLSEYLFWGSLIHYSAKPSDPIAILASLALCLLSQALHFCLAWTFFPVAQSFITSLPHQPFSPAHSGWLMTLSGPLISLSHVFIQNSPGFPGVRKVWF